MRARPSSEAPRDAADARVHSAPVLPSAARWRRSRHRHRVYAAAVCVALLVFIGWALAFLEIPLERLPGVLARMFDVLARRYYPPRLSHVMRLDYLRSVMETLQMSLVASAVGMVVAVPLAWLASFNVTPARRIGFPLARVVVTSCRSVHEMIWTILLVAIVGFGMLAGTLALTLFCIGFSGKLFAEAVEAVDPRPIEAVRAAGGGELQVLFYAVLPQVRVAWTGIAIYTWDVVFRAATVIGFFGAGGMGSYLRESVQRIESRQVAAIMLSIVAVVVVAEALSAWARLRVARAVA